MTFLSRTFLINNSIIRKNASVNNLNRSWCHLWVQKLASCCLDSNWAWTTAEINALLVPVVLWRSRPPLVPVYLLCSCFQWEQSIPTSNCIVMVAHPGFSSGSTELKPGSASLEGPLQFYPICNKNLHLGDCANGHRVWNKGRFYQYRHPAVYNMIT